VGSESKSQTDPTACRGSALGPMTQEKNRGICTGKSDGAEALAREKAWRCKRRGELMKVCEDNIVHETCRENM
jgi:hypothetical protein